MGSWQTLTIVVGVPTTKKELEEIPFIGEDGFDLGW